MKWISVKERLPSNKVTVLVLDKNGVVTDSHYEKITNSFPFCGSCTKSGLEVTHWMPLPKRLKKEFDDDIKKQESLGRIDQMMNQLIESLDVQEKDELYSLEKRFFEAMNEVEVAALKKHAQLWGSIEKIHQESTLESAPIVSKMMRDFFDAKEAILFKGKEKLIGKK